MYLKLKFKLAMACATALMVVSCGSSSDGGSTGTSEGTRVTPVATSRLYFDNAGQIPGQASGQNFMIRLHNSYDKQFSLDSLQVIDPITGKPNDKLATASGILCSTVPAKNYCTVNVTPTINNGSFILRAQLLDSSTGKIQVANQLMRVSDRIGGSDGIVFAHDLSTISAPDGDFHAAFPIYLEESFKDLVAKNGNIVCQNGFGKGSNCTYFMDVKSSAKSTLIDASVEGYKVSSNAAYKADSKVSSGYSVLATTNPIANILIAQPADITIGETATSGKTDVVLYNAGTANATISSRNITTLPSSGATGLISGEACSSLNINTTCSFDVEITSSQSGYANLNILYVYDSTGTGNYQSANVSANIVYIKQGDPAKLQIITTGGSLENMYPGTSNTQTFRLTNTGTTPLTNLNFSTNDTSKFIITGTGNNACSISSTLSINDFCDVAVTYTTISNDTAISANYQIISTADYKTSAGLDATLINQITQPYSIVSVNTALFTLNPAITDLLNSTTALLPVSKSVVMSNVSKYDLDINSIALDTVLTGLSIDSNDPTSCEEKGQLLGSATCNIKLNYLNNNNTASESTTLTVKVDSPISGVDAQYLEATSIINVVSSDSTQAYANVTDKVESASSFGVTLDSNTGIYSLVALAGNYVELDYTFTAESTGANANKFNVSSKLLPIGAEIVTDSTKTTCPIGQNISTLSTGDSCHVFVLVPKASVINLPGFMGGPLGVKLQYSYSSESIDSSATVTSQYNITETTETTFNIGTNWLNNLTVVAQTPTVDGNGDTVVVITTNFSEFNTEANNVTLPITVSTTGVSIPSQCDIKTANSGSCDMAVTIPKALPNQAYNLIVNINDDSKTRSYTRSVTVVKTQ